MLIQHMKIHILSMLAKGVTIIDKQVTTWLRTMYIQITSIITDTNASTIVSTTLYSRN